MSPLLRLDQVEARYGECQVLFGVTLAAEEGQVTTLLGRNGAGKTTTVRAIMGLTPPFAGRIALRERVLNGLAPERIAAAGIALAPEGRQIFPNLTVRENLAAFACAASSKPGWTMGRVLELFPSLAQRLGHMGHQLSGGEQQMLALGRALLRNGKLLIIDEATEGLAPLVREEIWNCLRLLKRDGMAILLIDKHLEPLLAVGDRHCVMDRGRVVWTGDSAALRQATDVWERYVGV